MNNINIGEDVFPIYNLRFTRYIGSTHAIVEFEDKYHAKYEAECKYYSSSYGKYVYINRKRFYVERYGE